MSDADALGRRVRRRRRGLGLSQDDLATRAGVSRASVSAVEAGRHLPRVDAALRLARALGMTVEDLLAVGPPRPAPVLGGEVAEGAPVRAARVGEHTVVAPIDEVESGLRAPDGVIREGRVHLVADAGLDRFVVAGCDPVLGVLADLMPAGPGGLLVVHASPAAARLALTTGRAHAAVVHDRRPPPPRDPDTIRRVPLGSWRTGLAVRSGDEPMLVAALAGEVEVVPADPGDAAQAAFERATDHAVPAAMPVARSHLDAARRALRDGSVVVTTEPAALLHGLAFQPLETHVVELWIDEAVMGHAGARGLVETLGAERFHDRVRVLPGYQLASIDR